MGDYWIYVIEIPATGKPFDAYYYVGSTIDLNARTSVHLSELHRGDHVNGRLQCLFDKYGNDGWKIHAWNFAFKNTEELRAAEDVVIKRYKHHDSILNLTSGGWVTKADNGLYAGAKPVHVVDHRTSRTYVFASTSAAGRYFGTSKTGIQYAIKNGTRLGGVLDVRLATYLEYEEWRDAGCVNAPVEPIPKPKAIRAVDVVTGVKYYFESGSEAQRFFGCGTDITRHGGFIERGNIRIEKITREEFKAWKDIDGVNPEYVRRDPIQRGKSVDIENVTTGEVTTFPSIAAAARALGCCDTAVTESRKSGKPFSKKRYKVLRVRDEGRRN